jgi:hypothetical protein
MVRAYVFALLLAAITIPWGISSIAKSGDAQDEPLAITCAEFVAKRPVLPWLRLTDCEADRTSFAREEDHDSGATTGIYLLLRPKGVTDGPAPLVILRADPDIITYVRRKPPPDDVVARVEKSFSEPIVGMVYASRRGTQLRNLDLDLADNFAEIRPFAEPEPTWLGIGILVFGLGMACVVGYGIWSHVRKK